ncbi:hypothetical protein EBU95_05350 [bacterium]|nr:hypothetical protein [bacterium]
MEFTCAKRTRKHKVVNMYIKGHRYPPPLRATFRIGRVLGRGLQGTVYKASYNSTRSRGGQGRDERVELAMKRTNVTDSEYKSAKKGNQFTKRALKNPVFIELASATLANQLVINGICPNIALNYNYEFIDDCNVSPEVSNKKFCSIQYNEYINYGTFQEWAAKNHREELWYNAIFQILAGLYALQMHFKLIHNDFHGRNLLVQRIEPGGYWIYIIDNVRYYVPNLGFVFLISDFGFSWIPGKMYPKHYVKKSQERYMLMDSNDTRLTRNTRLTWDLYKLKKLTIDPLMKVSKKIPKYLKGEFMETLRSLIDNTENVTTLGDIIRELYGSVIVKGVKCDDFPNHCYNKKRYVSGKRIETYNFHKKIPRVQSLGVLY